MLKGWWYILQYTVDYYVLSLTLIVLLLTGELLKEQEHLRQLMGDSVEEQRRKLQERLRRRKQRQAAGTLLSRRFPQKATIVVLSGNRFH